MTKSHKTKMPSSESSDSSSSDEVEICVKTKHHSHHKPHKSDKCKDKKDKKCKDKKDKKCKRSKSSSRSCSDKSRSNCSDSNSSDDKSKCTFEDVYNYYKFKLLTAGDIITVTNHSSIVQTITTSANSGGVYASMSSLVTIFKIAPTSSSSY